MLIELIKLMMNAVVIRLNPYSTGRCSLRIKPNVQNENKNSLNPYSTGRCSLSTTHINEEEKEKCVLILILLEDAH